jgi:hypothetical protein
VVIRPSQEDYAEGVSRLGPVGLREGAGGSTVTSYPATSLMKFRLPSKMASASLSNVAT